MERWIGYALLSMCFAGFTAVLAKAGLQGISSDLALGIRTIFVAVFVLLFCGWVVDPAERSAVTWQHVGWLALSALATAASWVFYYKALQSGDVASVALIDKGSVIVAMLLAWLMLGEAITLRSAAGALLIVTGLLVLVKR